MKSNRHSIRFGLMFSAASLAGLGAYAAAPPAGSVIGNQAAATYLNAAGDTISVTSNKVETIVQQVAGLTLVTDNSETGAPGGKVFLPHSVTNDGNGSDIFDLTAVDADTGGYDFVNVLIFPDANFDGLADSTTPIAVTPTLAAGESFGIVIEATIPSGAAPSAVETIDVLATSQFNNTVSASNTDTVTVSTGPVVEIVKSMTVAEGPGAAADGVTGPGDIVTIELTYSSTGLAAATDLIVTDVLDQYLDYTAASAGWSDSATDLTDANDAYEQANGSSQQIDYQYDGTDTVTFQIDSVPSGRTGSVTFEATIAANAPAGIITNVATQTVNGAAFPPSNQATVTVEEVNQFTAADAASATYQADPDSAVNLVAAPGSATDDDGVLNDIVEESTDAFQGSAIRFEFVLTNQSNADDSVDVSVSNTSFPAGTTFQILGPDNATPVVGPLGPLASGATTTVNVIATLPANATPAAAGTTNYEAVLAAQSINGGPVNTATAQFSGAVLGATVDLENENGTGDGPNPTNSGNPWIDYPTDPGQPVSFVVTVQNGGPTADSYDLTLDQPLPPGWTVSFLLPNGTPVTNTGSIPGGGELDITVVVTPPSNAPPADQPVTVAVTSPSTGQGDTLTNAVIVNTIADLAIASDNTVQVAPGGTADIPHTITNEGNVAITEGGVSLAGTFSTFSGTLFHDVNADGIVDVGDVVLDNIDDIAGGIAAGASVPVILRVQVPSTGSIGLSEAETITIAASLNSGALTDGDTGDNAVTDTVTIVSGDVTLGKVQAVDPNCNGNPGAFTAGQVQAEPGQCIRYRITASNTGTDNAGSVTITDTVPGFTVFTECAGNCTAAVTPGGSTITTQPGEGATGSLESAHGTLVPGAPATLSFTVRIDQ